MEVKWLICPRLGPQHQFSFSSAIYFSYCVSFENCCGIDQSPLFDIYLFLELFCFIVYCCVNMNMLFLSHDKFFSDHSFQIHLIFPWKLTCIKLLQRLPWCVCMAVYSLNFSSIKISQTWLPLKAHSRDVYIRSTFGLEISVFVSCSFKKTQLHLYLNLYFRHLVKWRNCWMVSRWGRVQQALKKSPPHFWHHQIWRFLTLLTGERRVMLHLLKTKGIVDLAGHSAQ